MSIHLCPNHWCAGFHFFHLSNEDVRDSTILSRAMFWIIHTLIGISLACYRPSCARRMR